MKNKKALMAIGGSILLAGAIIAWLMFGGSAPVNVNMGDGVSAKFNASLKNSVIKREKDGKMLWEFTVGEVINDKTKNQAVLKDVKGKVYRNDGSYLDITAERGSAVIDGNNFALEGKVQAVLSSGGKLLADKVAWQQDKDEWFASADKAITTSAFKKLKLTGNARVEKGGDMNDK